MHSVLVTGGSRGLGLAIAKTLARAGYRVVAIARSESAPLTAAMRDVRAAGTGGLHFHPFDLERVDDLPQLVKEVYRNFGPLYGLVNNAGIGTGGLLAVMPDAAIERLLRLNLLSPLTLTKYVVRSMMVSGGSRIINVASIVGSHGYKGLSVYSSTKAALLGFTHSLARELGPLEITVNAVAPGFVDTELTHGMSNAQRQQVVKRSALRRLADPDDVADAVTFLMSGKAKNITGTVLTVDAGNTA